MKWSTHIITVVKILLLQRITNIGVIYLNVRLHILYNIVLRVGRLSERVWHRKFARVDRLQSSNVCISDFSATENGYIMDGVGERDMRGGDARG